ncbi:hypothetical protein C8A05DRAFT_35946 [Staphylotrichum tortipilum]|uniref:NAD(P)-binding domain-containing protein n=1 Tax=Staphylotrichum tortipilum TaxID=2831512 RepID=A0AAN6RS30_9PEZI|nr:hypothetical protein C8A05DRAFT_35946 [Staphylotrichum longicolle]
MSTKPLTRVAIIGASGRIGGAFAKALVETGQHTVTALTRVGSNSKLPDGVQAVAVDYNDGAALEAALQGQQFLVITLGVQAADDLHKRIAAAAGKAGVPWVMPNVYGYPLAATSDLPNNGPQTRGWEERVTDVTGNGASAAVTLACGFWYEWSLATGEQWFGFRILERTVTLFDEGTRVITVSTWEQCGRALAALLSLPETGTSPSLADFKNRTMHIHSFRVSQRDMLDSLHRVLGTTDADWAISREGTTKRVADGTAEMRAGDVRGFAKMLYGTVFDPANQLSDFVGADNEVLGLPQEDLDEATRRAVEMVEAGWNPFPQ